jgi:hypothetical protein
MICYTYAYIISLKQLSTYLGLDFEYWVNF